MLYRKISSKIEQYLKSGSNKMLIVEAMPGSVYSVISLCLSKTRKKF